MAAAVRVWLYRLGLSLAALAFLAACSGGARPVEAPTSDPATVQESVAATLGELYFEPNRGQAQSDVAYVGRGRGIQVFAAPSWLGLTFPGTAAADGRKTVAGLRLTFAGAASTPQIGAERPQTARTNYLAGSAAPQPILDVPRFGRIRFAGLYPGIDLVMYERERDLEYDFQVAPGADPSAILLRMTGADSMRLLADGSLELELAGRHLVQLAPTIYQRVHGGQRPVAGGYRLNERGELGFWVGSYDTTYALVIDPVLAFSTYLTGDGADAALAVAVDINHDTGIYVAGRVLSNRDFPITEGSYKDDRGSPFFQYVVTKLTPAGDRIVFSTWFPAPIADIADAGLVGVYLAGRGCEFHFDPDARRDLSKCGIYAARLNAAGTKLDQWKVLIGPGLVTGMAAGDLGEVYVAGTAVTGELPTTPGVAQPKSAGSSDAFVVKFDLDSTGSSVKFATYLGGSGSDGAAGIALRRATLGSGEDLRFETILVVSGYTSSLDFPVTSGVFQRTRRGPTDAFVAKLDPFTGKLIAATYLGGSAREFVGTEFGGLRSGNVAISFSGNVYVVGSTESPDFPLRDPLPNLSKPVSGRVNDAFVTTFVPDLSATFRSTRLGGSGAESDLHIRVHNTDEIAYVLGNTRSSDFPLKDPIQNTYAGGTSLSGDLFIAKMRVGELVYSTYLGGSGFDDGNDIDIDLNDNVYVVGSTGTGFPLKNPLQATPGGSESYFVAKISAQAAPAAAGTSRFSSLRVGKSRHDSTLGHNIANVEVTRASQQNRIARFDAEVESASFLDFYDRTGGLERWGLATSEVFEETPGTLSQYYQRGVVDWKPAPGGGPVSLQRRLAWDFIGGGLGGSEDQGVEPGLTNPNQGDELGPWGHKVSNLAVDGTETGFKDFFDRLGGKDSFGFPKTDARPDTHADAVLHRPGRPKDDRIRQYFQAAVLEFHPGSSQPVKIGLIGDTLRNQKYPNNAWMELLAFQRAEPLTAGADLPRG